MHAIIADPACNANVVETHLDGCSGDCLVDEEVMDFIEVRIERFLEGFGFRRFPIIAVSTDNLAVEPTNFQIRVRTATDVTGL
jgi:hypothetical protein